MTKILNFLNTLDDQQFNDLSDDELIQMMDPYIIKLLQILNQNHK